MSVDKKQIESMAKIMEAMNRASAENIAAATPSRPIDTGVFPNIPIAPVPVSNDAMTSIMNSFNQATREVVAESSRTVDQELSLAVRTSKTPRGVRVGSWDIDVREEPNGKFYDIQHTVSRDVIASDIRLYEAAIGIVKALDRGDTFTSPTIRSILEFENDYARALSDALIFTQKTRLTEGAERDIANARLSEVKRRAMAARKAITNLTRD